VTPEQATALVELLVAAFPHPRVPELTVALYRDQLTALADADAARTAVHALIAHEEYFPPIALVLREYHPAARRNAEERARGHELEEPELDEETRVENVRRARELLDRLERGIAERAAEGGLTDWHSGTGEGDARGAPRR
jgi:hypothetical protein